jgi:hypothetical protein
MENSWSICFCQGYYCCLIIAHSQNGEPTLVHVSVSVDLCVQSCALEVGRVQSTEIILLVAKAAILPTAC